MAFFRARSINRKSPDYNDQDKPKDKKHKKGKPMTNTTRLVTQKLGDRVMRNTVEMLSYCKAQSFVVFDRESTHYQPHEHYGRIIELSAVKIVDDKIVDTFDMLINPEIAISAKITELTGITKEMVANAPTYQQALPKFIRFCEGSIVVAHNAMLDIKFVNFFSSKIGQPFEPKFIDTMNLCRYLDQKNRVTQEKPFKYNLKIMAEKYGVENNNHHRAMNDAVATAKLFLKLKELLNEDINNKVYIEELSFPQLPDAPLVRIGKISYWEKDVTTRVIQRIYVRLIYKEKIADMFYDFGGKFWSIKSAEFKTPSEEELTTLLMDFTGIKDPVKVYDVLTHKKG